eukprot:scaffold2006_cov141-Isochrysis_galbana.AAC.6
MLSNAAYTGRPEHPGTAAPACTSAASCRAGAAYGQGAGGEDRANKRASARAAAAAAMAVAGVMGTVVRQLAWWWAVVVSMGHGKCQPCCRTAGCVRARSCSPCARQQPAAAAARSKECQSGSATTTPSGAQPVGTCRACQHLLPAQASGVHLHAAPSFL